MLLSKKIDNTILRIIRKYEHERLNCHMEYKQVEMFKSGKPSGMIMNSTSEHDANEKNTNIPYLSKFHITSTDHHVIEIVSTYIKKLPDNDSKKQLARIMINFIMKSANL